MPHPMAAPARARRRLLIALLAVATAVVVIWLMLQPQLRKMQADAQRRSDRSCLLSWLSGVDRPPLNR